jgi:hypothetical protein
MVCRLCNSGHNLLIANLTPCMYYEGEKVRTWVCMKCKFGAKEKACMVRPTLFLCWINCLEYILYDYLFTATYMSGVYIANIYYNIAFVNSERWLAKSRVDITQCQHRNVGKCLSLCFFALYYKTNIKLFSILIYSYINTHGNWENEKLCGNTPPYNCISTRKMFYIC